MSVAGLCLALGACATVTTPPKAAEATAPRQQQIAAQEAASLPPVRQLKRKIAIGRFSNETRYGRTFFTDKAGDPLGKQASDILASRLVASKRFLVFERPDLGRIQAEQSVQKDSQLIGVDTLILGSVTEFGRATTGKDGFLSGTKIQTAHAKVELRLVDVKTGHAFFSATGAGEASTESGQIAGFGSKADYDGTLNDKAIAAAISDVLGRLMTKLEERQWKTDILKADARTVYISGGARQGIRVGDQLQVYEAGEQVKSAQTGFQISLPPRPVAKLRVQSSFGDSETNEGSVAELVSGTLPKSTANLFVAE
ncbi:curli production assembly protein CsgG [Cupriavidus sp. AU9028]|nr:curli production assembly protein CsgG [Cupriavidus sp. AU9028]